VIFLTFTGAQYNLLDFIRINSLMDQRITHQILAATVPSISVHNNLVTNKCTSQKKFYLVPTDK
jgi:hypothetical protein